MKLRALLDWRVFSVCLAASFFLAWFLHWLFKLDYWFSWGIVMFAWIGVGVFTLFDNGDPDRPIPDTPNDAKNAEHDV